MDDLEDGLDETHHSDDSCLLHEFTSASCSRSTRGSTTTSTPIRSRLARRSSTPCCSTSTLGRTPATCLPCPLLTSSRPTSRPTSSSLRSKFAAVDFEDFRSRIETLKRELKNSSESAETTTPSGSSWGSGKTDRSSCSINASRMIAPFCPAVSSRPLEEEEDRLPCGCNCVSWNVSLIRALRKDPGSIPERRADGNFGSIRTRQPGRADIGFSPRKGDLVIHHEKTPGRKVVEFYDPVCQRLQDGDILVRFRIDSYTCEGIVLVKGCGYVYHSGFWVYLGKDSDQISRSCIL